MKTLICGLIALCSLSFLNGRLSRHDFDGKINGENVVHTSSIFGDQLKVTDNFGQGLFYILDPFAGGCVERCQVHGEERYNCLRYANREQDHSQAGFERADSYITRMQDKILVKKSLK